MIDESPGVGKFSGEFCPLDALGNGPGRIGGCDGSPTGPRTQVKRVRFLVSELTGSRIEHEERQRAERLRERVQRLRDVGWDERADEIEQQSEQGWQL